MILQFLVRAEPAALAMAALLLVLGGGLMLAVTAREMATRKRQHLRGRLKLLLPQSSPAEPAPARTETAVRSGEGSALRERLQAELMRLGGPRVVGPAAALAMSAAIAVWLLAQFVFLSGAPLALALGLAVCAWLFVRQVKRTRLKRQLAFLDQMPDAIDLIVRAVQAGIPVSEAIGAVGTELAAPVGSAFGAIANKVRLGVELKDALYQAAESINLPDYDCFVVSLVVQQETGGQLSETLQNLAALIRRRKETRIKAKTLTAEGRLTTKVVAGLPFLTGGGLTVMNPSYMAVMINTETGRHMLLVALVGLAIGLAIIGNLTKAEL
jgi:tight adherence protein B